MHKKDITFLKIDNGSDAQAWFKANCNDALVIPLQPLMIKDQPNILPIQYFFTPDQTNDFEKFACLFELILKKSPKESLSKKACAQIAMDTLARPMDDLTTPIPWLSDVLQAYVTQSHIEAIHNEEARHLNHVSTWINNQYTKLIFFGWDDRFLNQVKLLISEISLDIHWVLPSLMTETKAMSMDDFIVSIEEENKVTSYSQDIHRFQSVSDEVKQVLQRLQNQSGQTILVAPNEIYINEIETEAIRSKLAIDSQPTVPLAQTVYGQIILAAIDYAKRPSMSALKQWLSVHAWFNHKTIKAQLHTIESGIGFYDDPKVAFKKALAYLKQDSTVLLPINIKTTNNLMSIIEGWKEPYEATIDQYKRFEQQEKIRIIVNDAITLQKSWEYIEFRLRKTTLSITKPSQARIVCITPESLCRYLDYPIWVMGLGGRSWSLPLSASYLHSDVASGANRQQDCRWGMANWALQHPRLLGVSMSEQVQNDDEFLPEQFQLNSLKVRAIESNEVRYTRKKRVINAHYKPMTLSPSKLHDYKRCPYSFYLKHILRVAPSQKVNSDHQILGIMIHQVIEAMVQQGGSDQVVINEWVSKQFNPLMAGVIKTKLALDWPLSDFITFCQANGTPTTEVTITQTIDQQRIEGRADIVIAGDNNTHVIDIKTGKLASKADIKQYEDLQLGLYIWMLQKDTALNAHYFGKKNQFKTMIDTESTDFNDYFLGLKDQVKALIRGIQKGDYSPDQALAKASFQANQCRLCDYYVVCHFPKRHQR